MGWLSDWLNKEDPLRHVDPTLREFLVKEAPKKYRPSGPEAEPETYRKQVGLVKEEEQSPQQQERPLPAEAVFQDGRYKHLWANYRPQAEIDQHGMSDQQKLMDVLYAYQDRQAGIKNTAIENCAEEQFNLHHCFRTGGWNSRMTMCRDETRSFNKCVVMQSKFLRALGYASLYDRPPEESENIQMHADRLYHRMLEQERIIQEAKDKGEPVPRLPPLMDFEKDAKPSGLPVHSKAPGVITFDSLPHDVQTQLAKERFAGLEGPELELAKRVLEEHIALNQDMVWRITTHWIQDRKERLERLARGEEKYSDKIMRFLDFRKYPDQN